MSNESTHCCGATRNVDFVNQTPHHFKNSVIQQMSSFLMKFNIISITFSTTYFLHPRLPHSATISGDDHTLSCFRNIMDTLWTLTLSLEYYTKTFIDAIMKLSTHTLNHGLTVIIPLLLLLVSCILPSMVNKRICYVMLCVNQGG